MKFPAGGWSALKSGRWVEAKMLLQVHDELIFEVPPQEIAGLIVILRECMEHAVNLEVPLKIDVNVAAARLLYGRVNPLLDAAVAGKVALDIILGFFSADAQFFARRYWTLWRRIMSLSKIFWPIGS